ncbi:hypothetical protein NON20_19380 [Synechocystis sp. B12]|nr:hypothetical protein NON20_19380 [Synechocystis sp. B12]
MTKTFPLSGQSVAINLQRKIFQKPLASLSLITLIIIVLSVVFGPIFYRVPIDQIDFSQTAVPLVGNIP